MERRFSCYINDNCRQPLGCSYVKELWILWTGIVKLFLVNAQLNAYFAMVLLVAAAYRTVVFETICLLNRKWLTTGYIIERAIFGTICYLKSNWLCFLFCYAMQVVELDFLYPSEGIHRRWENGYRITSTAATGDQAAFILSIPKRKLMDETQETLRTSAFPSNHVKVWSYIFILDYAVKISALIWTEN